MKLNNEKSAFLGLVNVHLMSRHQKAVAGKQELQIVDSWRNVKEMQAAAHMYAVSEIMNIRSKVTR